VTGQTLRQLLRVERPCRVYRKADLWVWACLCSPASWPYTASEPTWVAVQAAADHHMRTEHPAPAAPSLTSVGQNHMTRRSAALPAMNESPVYHQSAA
jgi:hypothetical protein